MPAARSSSPARRKKWPAANGRTRAASCGPICARRQAGNRNQVHGECGSSPPSASPGSGPLRQAMQAAADDSRSLEVDLPLKLHNARRPNTQVDDACVVRLAEVFVVEQIEYLRFKTQPHSLRDRRDLEERRIDIVESRTGHIIPGDVVQEVASECGTADVGLTIVWL